MQQSSNTEFIRANANTIYQAFANPIALQEWLAPGSMIGKLQHFDWREGGSYEMSLFYPENDTKQHGKSAANEDRYTAHIISLKPGKQIILKNSFNSTEPEFSGDMILEVNFIEKPAGTDVNFIFKNIPVGIKPSDNEKGTKLTLQQLKRYVEEGYAKIKDSSEIDEQDSDASANAFSNK